MRCMSLLMVYKASEIAAAPQSALTPAEKHPDLSCIKHMKSRFTQYVANAFLDDFDGLRAVRLPPNTV